MQKFNNFSIYIFKVFLSVLVLTYLLNQIDFEQLVENLNKFSLSCPTDECSAAAATGNRQHANENIHDSNHHNQYHTRVRNIVGNAAIRVTNGDDCPTAQHCACTQHDRRVLHTYAPRCPDALR